MKMVIVTSGLLACCEQDKLLGHRDSCTLHPLQVHFTRWEGRYLCRHCQAATSNPYGHLSWHYDEGDL